MRNGDFAPARCTKSTTSDVARFCISVSPISCETDENPNFRKFIISRLDSGSGVSSILQSQDETSAAAAAAAEEKKREYPKKVWSVLTGLRDGLFRQHPRSRR